MNVERVAKDAIQEPINGHQRRQALRREEIVVAATPLFFEKGYGRTSMDDVLAEIGGSKRTLYNHFKGKEELFAAIVRSVSGRVLANLNSEIEGDFEQGLIEMGVRYAETLFAPDTLALYRAVICEAHFFPELARAFFENGPVRVTKRLEQFFRQHNAEGLVLVREPEVAAKQFVGMLRGDLHLAAALGIKRPNRRQLQENVEKAVETLLNGKVAVLSER